MKPSIQMIVMPALLVCASLPVFAQDQYEQIEQRIRTLAPKAESIAVSETPLAGILQVQVGSEILYASADGKYLIQGRIIDLDTRADLTEQAKAVQRLELMKGIKLKEEITFAPPDPVYELTVFTDVDCGYCRKLHSQITEYNQQGISIHYMAFPRAGIGSPSYDKFVSVWCADDQQTALTNAKAGNDPVPEQCENPVAAQYELGVQMGITGTPALLTADGTLIPGYVPPADLRQRLDTMAGVAAATN
jgi:thiol:disulfide interchange protein DsbC